MSIWRRTDGKHTGVGRDEPAAECGMSEASEPGPLYIWDGQIPTDRKGGFPIDEYHPGSAVTGRLVIVAGQKPPFGEWEPLTEWPA